MGLHPGPLLLLLVGIPFAGSCLLVLDPSWLPALLILDGAAVLVAILDALLLTPGQRCFDCGSNCPRTWSHNRPETVEWNLDNRSRRAWSVEVGPDLPRALEPEEPRRRLWLPGRGRARLAFRIRASRRGTYRLGGLHVGVRSGLGLWRRHFLLREDRTVHVYPNLKQLSEYALLARTDRLSLIGVRRQRRTGGDTEFERLRDYQSGDPLQRVDWKATARRDDLTVRDYQITQSQSIVFLLDAGRMMVTRHREDGRDAGTLFDLAIDAALMMAWVALSQGDRVGLIAYADDLRRYVPPRGGSQQINHLIHAVHDLEPEMVESRHETAFLQLERRERKRSLAVVFTHVLDDVNARMLERHLAKLSARHLPLAVLLRDPDLHESYGRPPEDAASFWHAGAGALIAGWRDEVLRRLAATGAMTIDCAAERLTARVVSNYLEIKARHLL